MEPLKINIEVALSQPTLEVLDRIFGAKTCQAPGFDLPAIEQDRQAEPKTKKAPAPAPVPETPQPTAQDDDDLPPDDAPAPTKQISIPTEAEVRQAIKDTRSRGVSAKTIKEYMQEALGINTSAECPSERRWELIDGLKTLVA